MDEKSFISDFFLSSSGSFNQGAIHLRQWKSERAIYVRFNFISVNPYSRNQSLQYLALELFYMEDVQLFSKYKIIFPK